MDLAYIQTGISGVSLGFECQKSVFFFGGGGGCQINAVFLCVQQYVSGPVLFTKYFSKHSSSLLLCRS